MFANDVDDLLEHIFCVVANGETFLIIIEIQRRHSRTAPFSFNDKILCILMA